MRNFFFGLVVGFLVVGCAAWSFQDYRYYALHAASYDGTLSAVDPQNDTNFSICKPTGTDQTECIVMLVPEFYRLKADMEDCKAKQANPTPTN